jgi:hypothetical protein
MKTLTIFLALMVLPLSIFAADVTGTWKSEFDSQIGLQKYTFIFKQDGTSLTGKASSEAGERKREAELKEGKIDGDTVSFVEMLTIQDNEIRIAYKGMLSTDGNEIKFIREVGDFAKTEIVAKRDQTGSADSAPAAKALRIKAGRDTSLTDSSGNVWLAEQGFEGGASAMRDAKNGVIYLKVVNVDGKAQRINVQINGATKINSKGEAVVLAASNPNDTNLITERDKLVPHTEKVDGLSADFTREFPPYSVTILKLKTK